MKKLLALMLLMSLVATFTGLHYRSMRSADRELLRLGVEDAARTVRRLNFNLQSVYTVGESTVIAQANTAAELVARDRSYLESQDRLDGLRCALEMDHVCVSDSNGVIVASSPSRFLGHDLHSSAGWSDFLPALTNRAFAMLRPPCENVFGRISQYAAVSRRDSPGAVVIGYEGSIVGGFLEDTVAARVSKMRIGREGWLEVCPSEGQPPANTAVTIVDRDGENAYMLETDIEGFRLRGFVPVHGGVVADDYPFFITLIFDLLLVCALCMSFTPALRSALAEAGSALRLLFGRRASHGRYPLLVAVVAAPLLVIVLFAYGWFEYRGIQSDVSLMLETCLKDIVADIDGIPNSSLYLRAKAICLRYESPDAITATNVYDIAREYDLDELNVVDSSRRIVASTMSLSQGKLPDMDASPETRIFNTRLLDEGAELYDAPFRRSVTESQYERKYLGVAFARNRGGYVQVGYDRSRLRRDFASILAGIADDWNVGQKGFFIVTEAATGEVVSSGNESYPVGSRILGVPPELMVREMESGGLRIMAVLLRSDMWRVLLDNLMLNAIILAAFAVLIVVLLGRLFGLIAELRHFIVADREHRQQDLTLARTIQLSSLPVRLPDCDRYQVFTRITPAREVGGDFYDSYRLADGREVVTVADVSGKGVPAALFMMRAKTALKMAIVEANGELADAVALANRQLCENNEGEMFVTAWVGVFDPSTGEMKFVSAGHNPPLVRRRDGSVEWIRPRPSLVLAAMDIAKYRVESLTLSAGDSLFAYTDGVTEAQNAKGELFGESRLEAALKESGPLFVEAIGKAVAEFVDGAEPSDDITMLAFDCKRIGGAE